MDPWQIANGVLSLVGAALLSWLVLHPHVHEGVVIKSGLILMIFGLLANGALTLDNSTDWMHYWRAGSWLRLGVVVVCLGVLLRVTGFCSSRPKRRFSDWVHNGSHRGRRYEL